MTLPETRRPFSRKAFVDADEVVGARWWQESVRISATPVSRRRALQALAVIGGSAAVFGLVAAFLASDDHVDISMDALELQKLVLDASVAAIPGDPALRAHGNR